MKRTFPIGFMLLFMSLFSYGQQFFEFSQPSVNIGYSVIAEELPEGFTYRPTTLLASATIFQWKSLTVYSETQFTTVFDPIKADQEYEAGLNVGVQYRKGLFDGLSMTAAIGSGPHFISMETRMQARGFIFSDNFEMGFMYDFPTAGTSVNLRARFRHISNAGLQSPNRGIDNLFVVIGLSQYL